ncbi:MAG: hypothetical protein JWP08_2110, partial [Bryobacterales bacterium]|nr:hypothetical protein [Bryobacterales bacterium]
MKAKVFIAFNITETPRKFFISISQH